VSVPTDAAAEGELLPGGGMLDVERALLPLHGQTFRTHGALRQLALRDVGHPLEVVVACVAEMGRTCMIKTILKKGFSTTPWERKNEYYVSERWKQKSSLVRQCLTHTLLYTGTVLRIKVQHLRATVSTD
jgi:hypothetical protein